MTEAPRLRDSYSTQTTLKCPDTDEQFTLDFGPRKGDYQKGCWAIACPVCGKTHVLTFGKATERPA